MNSQIDHQMKILRYGAYICFAAPNGRHSAWATAPVSLLADRMKLRNEFEAGHGPQDDTIAFLRRVEASPGSIEDNALSKADAVIHVASVAASTIPNFCQEFTGLCRRELNLVVLSGVVRPTNYTSNLMQEFAYDRQVLPQPGWKMPNAFLIPMSKTAEWWSKDWMERHTYFLPRFDDDGKMISEGHVLVTAPGIECLLRRTYKSEAVPAPQGGYDFLTYFECSDTDLDIFRSICAALRDTRKNPEWKFVSEGPTWHGRRVATWQELFV